MDSNDGSDTVKMESPLRPRNERDYKFLSVPQLLRKINPTPSCQSIEDDDQRRINSVWSFQKTSWIFPTVFVVRYCQNGYHTMLIYDGADVHMHISSHDRINQFLRRLGYALPDHLTDPLPSSD
jgi:hypothetical protein